MARLFIVVAKPEFDFEFDSGFVPAKAYKGKLYRGFSRDFIPYSRWIKSEREIESYVRFWHGMEVFSEGEISIDQIKVFMDQDHEEVCFVRDYAPNRKDKGQGIDVIAPIVGSLIVTWLERFDGNIEGLNDSLLFDDPESATHFIGEYLAEAELGRIEPPNNVSDPTMVVVDLKRVRNR